MNDIIAPIIAILASVVTVLVAALSTWLARLQQKRATTLSDLQNRTFDLKKQQNELEKQQRMLLWQMEAAEIVNEDPRLAIVIAYQGLEAELQEKLQFANTLRGFEGQSIREVYEKRIESVMGEKYAENVKELRNRRNKVVHGEISQEELSSDETMEYIRQVISLSMMIVDPERHSDREGSVSQ